MSWLDQYKEGGMIKRADGHYSKRGLWDNIRDNAGSGKKPTKQMLQQEKKIKAAEHKQLGGTAKGKMLSKIEQEFMYGNPSAIRMMSYNTPSYLFKGNEGPTSNVPAGSVGTHYMSSMGEYAVPFIQQKANGEMYYNPKANFHDREAMRFNTPEEAEYFAEHYKEVAPMMQNFKQLGGYSTTGYKADSPDRYNPYNVIPTGRITMQNVPHPVHGIDNYGNHQIMMPGKEYQFPGQQVYEVPVMKEGGIPQRYRNMGFTHVGQKKTGDGQHKWKVLAKKGDQYKVVQGGYRGMQDFSQHHSEQRKKNFWNRMGGKDSAKATDPFSPLYWHKRLGTWETGGLVEMQGGGFTPSQSAALRQAQTSAPVSPYNDMDPAMLKQYQQMQPIQQYMKNITADELARNQAIANYKKRGQLQMSAVNQMTPEQKKQHEIERVKKFRAMNLTDEGETKPLTKLANDPAFNKDADKIMDVMNVMGGAEAIASLGKMGVKSAGKWLSKFKEAPLKAVLAESNVLPHYPYSFIEEIKPIQTSGNFPASSIGKAKNPTGMPTLVTVPELNKEQEILQRFGLNPNNPGKKQYGGKTGWLKKYK